MKTRELIKYTRRLIKGSRYRLLLMCMIPIGGELFFRASEAALYSLILYFGSIEPLKLFTGKIQEQAVISAVFSVIRSLVMPPLWCGTAARLMRFEEGREENDSFSDMLMSWKFIRRSIAASLFGKLISAAVLIPGAAAAVFGLKMLSDGADSRELIIATNLIAVGIAFVILWAAVRIGLTAVPFLLYKRQELSAVGVVMWSFRVMRGRRGLPIMLIIAYLPLILTIAAAPFLIPELAAAYAVGISIFLKEDEADCERAYIQGGNRTSETAEALSPRKLRRIQRAAAKAQRQ